MSPLQARNSTLNLGFTLDFDVMLFGYLLFSTLIVTLLFDNYACRGVAILDACLHADVLDNVMIYFSEVMNLSYF